MRFAFIKHQAGNHEVRVTCHILNVTTSGYYAWLERPESDHEATDRELRHTIRRIFDGNRGVYGSPRVHAELITQGYSVSRKRIERIMREDYLVARRPKRFRKTTLSDHDRRIAPNLLERHFTAEGCNEVWVGDLTYIWTGEGWLYLATLIDLASRRVVGWSAADHMRDELTLDALNEAIRRRRGCDLSGLIHHSDRGSQYASQDYIDALNVHDIQRSMSKRGDCWDNAVAESFFATLKKELVYRHDFQTRAEAIAELYEYIEVFYNRVRLHSTNDYMAPAAFEAAIEACP